jgi:cyclic lactone autoinducer peptide
MLRSKIAMRFARLLVLMAPYIAGLASESCRIIWYQPKEPDGLEEFAKKFKR